jgi:hypothetical protein
MRANTELNGATAASSSRCIEYREYDWGDWIAGTKEQLQELGLGTGLTYPGEPGGKKRLKVRDPRGYIAEISCCGYEEGIFTARIDFHERPRRPYPSLLPALPGIRKCEHYRFDEYVGSAEALTAAGLVSAGQLPGQPGMRKMRVTIFPDGTIPSGAPTANHREAGLPGARCIERVGVRNYSVQINVPKEEQARRLADAQAAIAAWEHKVRSLPRPPRLGEATPPALATQPARGHLRLVWSAA